MKISKIFGATLLVVAITACDNNEQSTNKHTGKRESKSGKLNNESSKPIFIKDLTTGMNSKHKEFSQKLKPLGSSLSIGQIQYFGKERSLRYKTTNDGTVYSYEMLVGSDASDIRKAIEEKLSEQNEKQILFSCKEEEYKAGLNWRAKTCIITSGSQILTVVEKKPTDIKPDNMSISTWSAMHIASLILTDSSIEALAKNEEKNAAEKREEELRREKNKAKKDI